MSQDGAPPPPPPGPADEAMPAAPAESAPQEGEQAPGAAPAAPAAPAQEGAEAAQDAPAPPKAPEPPKELEEDAPALAGAALSREVGFNTEDTTMNVMPSQRGNLLMALTDSGMQYLLAGARANVGMKAGRYLFEVKIVEILEPVDSQGPHSRVVQPRNLLRLGFSTSNSSLFMGETEDSVCFDSEGRFAHNRTVTVPSQKFGRDQVMGVLLNLDASGPNANTISLFRDGVRVSQPQPLPEALKGKALFPTLNYRNVSLSFNFGPTPKAELPFKCHMIGKAAVADVQVVEPKVAKDGKFEVMFPVLLPDEGTFDWVDLFLQQHPEYTELSDRMILDWCEKSGIQRSRGYRWRTCNDKPDMSMGVPELDTMQVRRVLRSIAPVQRRNFLVVEVKSNLTLSERKELLARFPHFKKTAQVLIGDPTADFKKRTPELMLKLKQEKADAEFKVKQAEEIRKYQAEKAAKEGERAAKKARKEAERKAEEERRAAAGEEAPDQEMKPAEEEEPVMGPDPAQEKPPTVQLTPEELQVIFRPLEFPDLTDFALSTSMNDFSLPEKTEGFDAVQYPWLARTKAEPYFKEWRLKRKITTKVEDLKIGDWFNQKSNAWKEQLQHWKGLQAVWKANGSKKEEEPKDSPMEQAPENEEGEPKPEVKKDEPMCLGVADEDLDVFGANVNDLGNGEPLCSHFGFEDWMLLQLRVEFHLMVHGFKKDVTDPERPGIQVENVPYYYNKYFRKTFAASHYGYESNEKVMDLLKDTVVLNGQKVLVPELAEELDNFDLFLKLTEEGRRERELMIDYGDEDAALRFNHTALNAIMGGKGFFKGVMPGKGMDKGKAFQGKGMPWQGQMQKGYDSKGYGGGGWGKPGMAMGGKPPQQLGVGRKLLMYFASVSNSAKKAQNWKDGRQEGLQQLRQGLREVNGMRCRGYLVPTSAATSKAHGVQYFRCLSY
ncbi:unnamed protein product [Effrenium voratum]|nr:unnamed protein product [Effrenium voratum]